MWLPLWVKHTQKPGLTQLSSLFSSLIRANDDEAGAFEASGGLFTLHHHLSRACGRRQTFPFVTIGHWKRPDRSSDDWRRPACQSPALITQWRHSITGLCWPWLSPLAQSRRPGLGMPNTELVKDQVCVKDPTTITDKLNLVMLQEPSSSTRRYRSIG